jgi:hypothetical protein
VVRPPLLLRGGGRGHSPQLPVPSFQQLDVPSTHTQVHTQHTEDR